jgi:hypothetical protein
MVYQEKNSERSGWKGSMPNILLEIEDLNSRGEKIRGLLRPLTRRPDGPAWQRRSRSRVFIIGTHDGSPTQSDFRDWRFSTFVPNYRGMYFELWRSINEKIWYLDQAYLNIYRSEPHEHTEAEYLCLHCDPNEPEHAPHSIYKRGPHLHIKGGSPAPLPKSHIALQQDVHLDVTLNSCDSLMHALSWGIRMIKEEILDEILEDMVAGI